MWQIKNIHFKNLFSHEDTQYEFRNNACTIIMGENRDEGGNNAAGKTTIFEAISLALTNSPLRDDIDKEVFINRDFEDCWIELFMENKYMKSTLKITRQFFRGNKPVRVQIEENGELNTTLVSTNEANKRILELIGISREDLRRYFIIDQDNEYNFFKAGDVKKKEVLNRITSASMVNAAMDKLSENKKKLSEQKSKLSEQSISLNSKLDTLKEQLDEQLAVNNDDEIKSLNDKKIAVERKISAYREEVSELHSDLAKAEKRLSTIKVEDTDKLKKRKKKLKDEIEELENTIGENNKVIKVAKSDLEGSVTCPNCNEVFLVDNQLHLSIEETREVISDAETENEKLNKDLSDKRNKLKDIQSKLQESEELIEKQSALKSRIKKLKLKIDEKEEYINSGNRKIEKINNDIEDLKKSVGNISLIKSLKDKIETCSKDLKKIEEDVKPIDEELAMVDYWIYYMGKSGFMTYLANKSISVLEGCVNSFLRKFKSPLSVSISGYKVLKDGSVRDKINISVLKNGLNAEPYMGKSGGERDRLNLAVLLSIQHLINLSTDGRGINLLVLDETFGCIDSVGQEGIIKILENLGITILMITQNISSEFNNENRVVVVKENDVSRILN